MLDKFKAALAWPLWLVVGLPGAIAPAQARPDPSDSAAAVPAAPYQSALRDYRGFTDPERGPWRELNDRVGQRGGWRAYAREPRADDAPVAPPAAASSPLRAVP